MQGGANATYLAPLLDPEGLGHIAGEYIVVLQPSSTIGDHFEAVGSNLTETGHAIQLYRVCTERAICSCWEAPLLTH